MKYPERLSPERLFFLTKEERAIYESEWAEHLNKQDNDITIMEEEVDMKLIGKTLAKMVSDFIRPYYMKQF